MVKGIYMKCHCGHYDFEHGPLAGNSLCALCLCNQFVVVLVKPREDLNLLYSKGEILEALHRAELAYGSTLAGTLGDILIKKLKEVADEMAKVGE